MRLCDRERAFLGLVVLACALGACSADCPNFVTIDEVPDDHKLTDGNMNRLPTPPLHTHDTRNARKRHKKGLNNRLPHTLCKQR